LETCQVWASLPTLFDKIQIMYNITIILLNFGSKSVVHIIENPVIITEISMKKGLSRKMGMRL